MSAGMALALIKLCSIAALTTGFAPSRRLPRIATSTTGFALPRRASQPLHHAPARPLPRAALRAQFDDEDPQAFARLSGDAAVILCALTSQKLVDEVLGGADFFAPVVASDLDALPGLVSETSAWLLCWIGAAVYRGGFVVPDVAPRLSFDAAVNAANFRSLLVLGQVAVLRSPIDVSEYVVEVVDVVVWLTAWRAFTASRLR